MNGAAALCRALEAEGVDVIFGYPGGAIMPVYDALVDSTLKHVLCRHEQGAALAADGYARASGRVGVCLATSGPGATNLVTGIANAYMDSIPMVAITGQVANNLIGTDAFQEVDVFGITMPIVKHSFLVRKADDLPRVVSEAFRLAREGRPGPVLIDIPKDVQNASVSTPYVVSKSSRAPAADAASLLRARTLLTEAKKPLLYVGGGAVLGDAVEAVRAFADITGMPAVQTLKGLGTLPASHAANLGMLGMHGFRPANMAVQECDLLIAVGARFDDRATGRLDQFAPHARVLQLDIDAAECGKLRAADVSLCGDLTASLNALAQPLLIDDWRAHCLDRKQALAWRYDAPFDGVYAPDFLRELSEKAGAGTYITCDVGQHQMWVAQHYGFHHPREHLTSGGLGTMGYGLPAAIGAQLGQPDARVICVSGDGSFMMNVQELATIKRYGLPVKIVLFDNSTLGMVRQWQELFFAERYSEIDLSDNPDFIDLAKVFEVPGRRITHKAEQSRAIAELLAAPGAYLLHVCIDPKDNVWPLVPPGKSNSDMMEGASA